jgi:inner membrane protein
MMALTHMVLSAAGCSFGIAPSLPVLLGAVLGSQLPDIDTSTSWIGSVFFPISSWIEKRYPHRTVTHSFLATGAIALLALPLAFWNWQCWLSIPLGHLIAIFSDTFTKKGVQLFFPAPAWCVCGANPNRRLATGSTPEYFVLAIAVGLLVFNLQTATQGGWVRAATQAIGLRDSAIEVYNSEANKSHIWADVTGYWVGDRSKADGAYFVIGVENGDFILQNERGLYKTGQNLIADRLTVRKGRTASISTQSLAFSDQEPASQLQQLQHSHPSSAVFLSGLLKIDFPEEMVMSAIQPNQLKTIALVGDTVTLNHCPIDQALIYLKDQYATGTLTAKTLTPRAL